MYRILSDRMLHCSWTNWLTSRYKMCQITHPTENALLSQTQLCLVRIKWILCCWWELLTYIFTTGKLSPGLVSRSASPKAAADQQKVHQGQTNHEWIMAKLLMSNRDTVKKKRGQRWDGMRNRIKNQDGKKKNACTHVKWNMYFLRPISTFTLLIFCNCVTSYVRLTYWPGPQEFYVCRHPIN